MKCFKCGQQEAVYQGRICELCSRGLCKECHDKFREEKWASDWEDENYEEESWAIYYAYFPQDFELWRLPAESSMLVCGSCLNQDETLSREGAECSHVV